MPRGSSSRNPQLVEVRRNSVKRLSWKESETGLGRSSSCTPYSTAAQPKQNAREDPRDPAGGK